MKNLDLNAYGVNEMSIADARKTNGGMTFQADAMAMSGIDRHAVAQTQLFYVGYVWGFLQGFFR
jgi:hypothetical protein